MELIVDKTKLQIKNTNIKHYSGLCYNERTITDSLKKSLLCEDSASNIISPLKYLKRILTTDIKS